MPRDYDLAVIGGGASGLAAAVTAAEIGEKVFLLEAGPALGRKILASGNGRCNLMNSGKPVYYGDASFAEDVIRRCGVIELTRFWHHLGVCITEDETGRCYPVTFQAATVLNALKTGIRMAGAEVRLNSPCKGIRSLGKEGFQILTPDGSFTVRRALIATGGAACRKLGGTGSGYQLLQDMGHTMMPIRPSLTPLTADPKSISGLAGIRYRCGLTLLDKDHLPLHRESGEVLFTDYGVSGICVMQCARFVTGSDCRLELDLGRKVFRDRKSMEAEIRYRRERFRDLPPDMLLNGILPGKLSFAVMKQAGLPMRGESIGTLDDHVISRITDVFHAYQIPISGTKGLEDAQVTAGGILCDEFRSANMESRIIPGIHASGEVLNSDGDCGGFNLMFAFASGILAGLNDQSFPF